jgi:YjbE family integral membrane protein
MELFSVQWWYALGAIILIDLVLAGDNSLVIGIAASKLRPDLRKKAILWGSAGALVVRGSMALIVVWLLQVPGLLLAGGLLLLPVAYKLAKPSTENNLDEHSASSSFWGAMKTIVIADALMGIDNVLAVGGAAQGRWELVIIGLLITIPLIFYGSTWVSKAIIRWPMLSAFGAAVLAFTAISMLIKDPLFNTYIVNNDMVDLALKVGVTAAIFGIGYFHQKKAIAHVA